MKNIVFTICMAVIIILSIYQMWWFGRRINYKLSYEDMVNRTVRSMVKPEALK